MSCVRTRLPVIEPWGMKKADAINPYGDCDAVPRVLVAIAELAGVGERLEDFQP